MRVLSTLNFIVIVWGDFLFIAFIYIYSYKARALRPTLIHRGMTKTGKTRVESREDMKG